MKHVKRKRRVELLFPRWAFAVYFASALILTPWTYSLAWFLPKDHLARNWDMAWVGFDLLVLIMFVSTMILALRKSVWSLMTSVVLATLMFVDAWFDVITASPGIEMRHSVFSAVIETGLGTVIIYLVYSLVKELRAGFERS